MADNPEKSSAFDIDRTALQARLNDPKMAVWSKAVKELCQMGAAAIPLMIDFLACENEDVRGYIAASLGELGPLAKAAVPSLLGLLNDRGAMWFHGKRRNYLVRFRAAFAIAKIDPEREEFIPALHEATQYRKLDYIRGEACEVISTLGPRAKVFIPELKAAEIDSNQTDRIRAQLTLAKLDSNYEITDELAKRIKKVVSAE